MDKIIENTLNSGNIHANLYMAQEMLGDNNIISKRLNSGDYNFNKLTITDIKNILKENGLDEDGLLMGCHVHSILGDIQTKTCSWVSVGEIDPVIIMDYMDLIKTK